MRLRINPVYILICAALLAVSSCARMGQPDGGWYDETPPRILGEYPKAGSTKVDARKISILFDEFVKLDNASEKVVVSPPQLEQPDIKAQGKRITVELKDSLKPNTTYTIDFSDAISDFTEGNPLGNYTYTFSTSEQVDTMEVSGRVVDAENLEPVKGILVGLYADLADSAFTTKPLLRVSRTDGDGKFVIRGVADGKYRVCALEDADANYMYSQKSERLAFDSRVIETSCQPAVRQDTIWRDSLHIADIIPTRYTRFMPDDIILRAFTAEQTDRYLLKTERKDASSFTLFFSHGDSELPRIKGLNFNADGAFITEPSERLDTITYWLRDSMLVNQDTLRIELTYNATDTLGVLHQQTDTLDVLSKAPYEKRLKQMEKEREDWQKRQDKARKRGEAYETEMPAPHQEPKYSVPSEIAPDGRLRIQFPTPQRRDESDMAYMIHLWLVKDSTETSVPATMRASTTEHRSYDVVADWTPGGQYRLDIDSAAFVDIYGRANVHVEQKFRVKNLDDYGSLKVTLSGMQDSTCVVYLLDSSQKVVRSVTTTDGVALIKLVPPGKYYLRMLVDTNGNGRWDTGCYEEGRQPEAVYFYPKDVECKAKWEDIPVEWDPLQLPLDRQKPSVLVKQKGDKKKTIRNRNMDRAREKGIDYTRIPGWQ